METTCLLELQMEGSGILGQDDLSGKCVVNQRADSGDEVCHMLLGSEEVVCESSCISSSIDFEFTNPDLESGPDFSMDHSSVFDITESVIGGEKVDSSDLFTDSNIFDESDVKQAVRVDGVDGLNVSFSGQKLNLCHDLGLKLQIIPLDNLQFVSTVETSEGLHILAVPAGSSLCETTSVTPFANSLENLSVSNLCAIHPDFTKCLQHSSHYRDGRLSIEEFKSANSISPNSVVQVIQFKNSDDLEMPILQNRVQTFGSNTVICADDTYSTQQSVVNLDLATNCLSPLPSHTMTELTKSVSSQPENTSNHTQGINTYNVTNDTSKSTLRESKIFIDLRKLIPNRKRRLVSLLNNAHTSKLHLLQKAKDAGSIHTDIKASVSESSDDPVGIDVLPALQRLSPVPTDLQSVSEGLEKETEQWSKTNMDASITCPQESNEGAKTGKDVPEDISTSKDIHGKKSDWKDSTQGTDSEAFCLESINKSMDDTQISSNKETHLQLRSEIQETPSSERYENSKKETHAKWLKCEQCFAKFTREGNLKNHLVMHEKLSCNGNKLGEWQSENKQESVCQECPKSDLFSEVEQGDSKLMESEETTELRCEICAMVFTTEGNLTRHKLTHTVPSKGALRFQCDVCNKSYLQKCDLKRHQLVHTRQYPYTCSTCDKGFIRKSDLVVHERFHSKEKQFRCDLCAKTYYQSGDLHRHIRLAHENLCEFSCQYCHKKYMTRKSLHQHEKNKH